MNARLTLEEFPLNGFLAQVELSVDFTRSRYYPARIGRDPDDSYEAEGGEVELGELRVTSATVYLDADDAGHEATEAELSALQYAVDARKGADWWHRINAACEEADGDE